MIMDHTSHIVPNEVYWVQGGDGRFLVRMAFGDHVLTHLVCATRNEAEAICRNLCKHYGISAQKAALPKGVQNA
jgi:hypothetical protein